MPFSFKLSVRLALMKSSVVLAAAALIACELPGRRVAGPGNKPVAQVVTSPDTAVLDPLQSRQFVAFGRTQAGDSIAVAVAWTASGGTITAAGLYTADTLAGNFQVTASDLNSAVSGSSGVKNRGALAQVILTPAIVSLAAGTSQQFSSYGIRRNGDSVAVAASYAATGGSIAAAGLYTAGSTPGTYSVVASESTRGLADTSSVTVTGIPAPPPPPPPPPPPGAGHYVAPTGSASGDGTAARPWDLRTALAHPAAVQPGDTIWLRGGTYVGQPRDMTGAFVSSLTGTPSAPIVVRQYPGERATLDGFLRIRGGWTYYWGFEVMFSDPAGRVTSIAGSFPSDVVRVNFSVDVRAPNIKCINLVIHDLGGGIGANVEAINAEFYGNILYNNGWEGPDRGHGHGVYTQNDDGSTVRLIDNLLFNQYGSGVHAFGSSAARVRHYVVEGNAAFQNGGYQYIVGGADPTVDVTFTDNYSYGTVVSMGWNLGAGPNSGLTMRNNVLSGEVTFNQWSDFEATNNTFIVPSAGVWMVVPTGASTAAYNMNYNSYYSSAATPFWLNGVGERSFAEWKSLTGLDLASSLQASMSGLRIFVRPNQYERGRGHVIIFNLDGGAAAAAVDLSSILQTGQRFEVRNAQNFFGPPVASGTYGGGAVTLPLSGLTAVAPIGHESRPSRATSQFNAFVVLPQP